MNITPTLDHVLTAIADPTRRAILDRLARGPARVTDVAEPFEMSLAAVSKHVQMLEHAGLVRRSRQGREHTWVSEATRGLESVVTITLAPRDGGTEITLHHANLPDDEMGRQHKEGWTWYLNVLGERFEKAAAR